MNRLGGRSLYPRSRWALDTAFQTVLFCHSIVIVNSFLSVMAYRSMTKKDLNAQADWQT